MAQTTVESYTPSPQESAFHADGTKHRLLLGAWGAGKTTALIWEIITLALEYRGCLIVVFRKTYPALRDTTWKDLRAEIPESLIVNEVKTEGREEIELLGGSRIWGRCLDDWKKHGSQAFDVVVIDEAWEVREEDNRMVTIGRLRGKVGPRRSILATNPPNQNHWLHKLFEVDKKDDADYRVHHFSTYGNVRVCESAACPEATLIVEGDRVRYTHEHSNLPPGYLKDLEKMPESWRRRMLHGQWGFLAEGTPVYGEEMFAEHTHVTPLKAVPGVTLLRGWDFGYHVPVCLWGQVLPTGHCNILHELYGRKEDLDIFVKRVIQETRRVFPQFRPDEIEDYCDVAGKQDHGLGKTSIGILREHDIHPMFRKIDLWKSIKEVRTLMRTWSRGRPLLQMNERHCPSTVEACAGGYVLEVKPNGIEEPVKDKWYEHFADTLRYILAPSMLPMPKKKAGRDKSTFGSRMRVAV